MPSHRDGQPTAAQTGASSSDTAETITVRLLTLLQELLLEIRQSERAVAALTLDSHLERDLALDSLARTELLQRIERAFQIKLSEQALLVETPRQLVTLILQASGAPAETLPAPDWQAPTLTGQPASGTPAKIATQENRVQHPGDAFAFSPAISGSVNPA